MRFYRCVYTFFFQVKGVCCCCFLAIYPPPPQLPNWGNSSFKLSFPCVPSTFKPLPLVKNEPYLHEVIFA